MLRNVWLIARREYLGYVAAWGFWLGLILTPVGILAGAVIPGLVQSTQPVRYFAVVDDGSDYAPTLDKQLESWRAAETQSRLEQYAAGQSPDKARAIVQAYESARADLASPEEALRAAGAPRDIRAAEDRFVRISPPDASLSDLEEAILSGRTLQGPAGERPLFAVLKVNRAADGDISNVDYISSDVVVNELRSMANWSLRRIARDAYLASGGLDSEEMRRIEVRAPHVASRLPGAAAPDAQDGSGESGAPSSTEVSFADKAPYVASVAGAIALWLLIFSVVNFLLTGTIEERFNKIFDSLLTCVRLPELLAGKLLGVLMLSMTLMGAWAVLAVWAMVSLGGDTSEVAGAFLDAALKPSIVIPAIAGFTFGYTLYGAIFLALGSLCDTIQEAQTLISPLIVILMIPLLLVMVSVGNPTSELVRTLSWVPIFTPFLMILRAPIDAPLWEILGQIAVMAAFTGVTLWAATRVYRAGAVHGAGVADIRRLLFRKKTATA